MPIKLNASVEPLKLTASNLCKLVSDSKEWAIRHGTSNEAALARYDKLITDINSDASPANWDVSLLLHIIEIQTDFES